MNKSSVAVRLFFLTCLLCSISVTQAQTFDEYKKRVHTRFNQYKSDKEREFKEYRDRINAEFAGYMRQSWFECRAKPAEPMPDSPKPPISCSILFRQHLNMQLMTNSLDRNGHCLQTKRCSIPIPIVRIGQFCTRYSCVNCWVWMSYCFIIPDIWQRRYVLTRMCQVIIW